MPSEVKALTLDDIISIENYVLGAPIPSMSIEEKMEYLRYCGFALGSLLTEVRRLRQGLWDCAAISGADQDGDRTPDAMTYPDIVEYAKREVKILRDDYDEALVEMKR